MICPKCEEGMLNKIVFKRNRNVGDLCNQCGMVWFKNEIISPTTGHPIQAYTQNGEMDYTFVDIDEKSLENEPVQYPPFK